MEDYDNFEKLNIYLMYNEEKFLDEAKLSQNSPYSEYFLVYFAFSFILRHRILEFLAEIF